MTPVKYTTREITTTTYESRRQRDEETEKSQAESKLWLFGVWGGAHEWDRWALRHLPPDEAVEQLEASFAERLRTHVAAYTRRRKTEPRNRRGTRAVAALLAARRTVTRLEQGNPGGPGRGHRGPIALLAAELGVSRSTAWRRLRASSFAASEVS
jgi:hypothetical protein